MENDLFGQAVPQGLRVRLALALHAAFDRLCPARRREAPGPWGERWAVRLLRAEGCSILARNARPGHRDEIDIVAREGRVFLFVEVKTRRPGSPGRPLQAIDARKRAHLRRAARHWLARHGLPADGTRHRFDAVEVVGSPVLGEIPALLHIRRLRMP